MESLIEKKAIAPSQKIVSRGSPGQTKKTYIEEGRLLKYDALPKAHIPLDIKGKSQEDNSKREAAVESPVVSENTGQQQGNIREKYYPNYDRLGTVHSYKRENGKAGDVETNFNSPDSPVVKYHGSPSHRDSAESRQATQSSQQMGHRIHSAQVTGTSSPRLPATSKNVTDPDVHLPQQDVEQEEFV